MRYPILLLCFFFYACGNKNGPPIVKTHGIPIERYYDTVSDMTYIIYKYNSYNVVVVNLTKDSLECEYYKQQLNKK